MLKRRDRQAISIRGVIAGLGRVWPHHGGTVPGHQRRLREEAIGYVKDGTLHIALRRTQALLFSPRFWGVILAISIVLGIAGPFGTYERLAFLPRFAYWFAVALATFLTGYLAIILMLNYLLGDVGTRPIRIALSGLAAGVPVTAVVILLNTAIFDDQASATGDILTLFVNCSLIAAAISFLFGLVDDGSRQVAMKGDEAIPVIGPLPGKEAAEARFSSSSEPAPQRPRLLDRLPPHLRGRIAYLSMQDHYVGVHTDKGSTLVLMRLADAIGETGSVPGLQIHRSHWVAIEAVVGNARKDGKLFLRMTDGTLLPVSRSFLGAVREAGLV